MKPIRCRAALLAALAAAPAAAQQSPGDPPADTVTAESVDQRLRILERRLELEQEAAARASAATVATGADGLQVRSADGAYQVRLRGYVHSDGRYFFEGTAPAASTFQLRRIRPILEGVVARNYHFRLMTDFGGGSVTVQDAHLDAVFGSVLRVRVGKFKPPVGLERLQSATAMSFVERALPTALVPSRDVGVQLYGELAGGAVGYQAGVFNGVVDGGSGDVDVDPHKDVAGRLFLQPFRGAGPELLRGLGVGIAGSRGRQEGTATAPGLPGYRTVGQQSFFAYRSNGQAAGTAIADGRRTRLSPQGWLYFRGLGLTGEHVSATHRVRRESEVAELTHRAWQGTATLLLTGEDAAYTGVRPRAVFDPARRTWGAVELAARASRLEVDEDAFPTFADPARSASSARHWGVGVNWYLNRNVRLSADYDRTTFGAAGDAPRRDPEQGILTRVQLSF